MASLSGKQAPPGAAPSPSQLSVHEGLLLHPPPWTQASREASSGLLLLDVSCALGSFEGLSIPF